MTVRDGTRLAVYIFRPTIDAVVVTDPLPVVWMHNRYHGQPASAERIESWRAQFPWLALAGPDDATPRISLADTPWLEELLAHGYVIGIVDVRGGGASFGVSSGPFAPEEARDTHDITEWFAQQPWCDGAVGMFGRSYMGTNQYFVADAPPPHLRAIFTEMALFDLYAFIRPGGVFREDFARNWASDVARRDGSDPAVAVDGDTDELQLRLARAQHQGNRDAHRMFADLPFRDSVDPATGERPYLLRCPTGAGQRRLAVPVYLLAGWHDPFVRDAFAWFANSVGPRRLVVGPWAHTGSLGFDLAAEHLRWYDRWLKRNDADPITDEPPIHYYTIGAPAGSRWRSTWRWPLPEAEPTCLHLGAGPAGTVRSCNDGVLAAGAGGDGFDEYTVDDTATSGRATRWTNGYGGPYGYPDMATNDAKGLTYTSAALERDTEITGHPVLHLWVSSTAEDADFFAYLEMVAPDGASTYVSEGVLRASHRRTGAPPYEYLGLPYHRSFAEDVAPLSGHAADELLLDLHPISRVFAQGHRIRLTITCADHDNALALTRTPPATVRVHHSVAHPSRLILPIVPAAAQPAD